MLLICVRCVFMSVLLLIFMFFLWCGLIVYLNVWLFICLCGRLFVCGGLYLYFLKNLCHCLFARAIVCLCSCLLVSVVVYLSMWLFICECGSLLLCVVVFVVICVCDCLYLCGCLFAWQLFAWVAHNSCFGGPNIANKQTIDYQNVEVCRQVWYEYICPSFFAH